MKLRLDFETYSDLDLTVVGAYAYAKHPSTRILMLGYKEYKKPAKIWEPGMEVPEEVTTADRFYAHNAVFEYLIFKYCGGSVGLPSPSLDQFIDVMCLCGKYSYPLGLDKAARALNCDVQKSARGAALIKKFCSPTGYNKQNSPSEWAEFAAYCLDDVDAMDEVIKRLPHHELSSYDQRLWEINAEINMRGVPVDRTEAEAVYQYVKVYAETHAERLPELTDGAVTKATQVQRIKKWVEAQGYPMPDGLGAQLIEEALDGPNPPPDHVAEVLSIRKEMGSSSAAKFKLAMDLEHEGRIHMSLIKNGASTGRYASWNFQLHNLAKLCAEDPDELFRRFKEIEDIDKPFRAAKSLVRALIKAPKGRSLCVADWSGIETHLLFWFVGDEAALAVLRERGDLYAIMAAEIYNVPVDEVCRDTQRPLGKALILGCGYGMGFKRFKEAAKTFGVFVELPEANLAVSKYRLKFPKVQKVWYELTNAARLAILRPNTKVPCHKVWFYFDGKSLWTELPSGRKLHYPEACIKEGDVQYYSADAKSGQWCAHRLTPSQNIENIIQAIAADILELSITNIDTDLKTHEHIGHVHDENITLVDDTVKDPLEALVEVMCRPIKWAPGLPLFAEGYVAKRFRK